MTDASNAQKPTSTAPRTVAELQEFLKSIPGDYQLCFLLGDSFVPYDIARAEMVCREDDWEMLDFLIKKVVVPDGPEA